MLVLTTFCKEMIATFLSPYDLQNVISNVQLLEEVVRVHLCSMDRTT